MKRFLLTFILCAAGVAAMLGQNAIMQKGDNYGVTDASGNWIISPDKYYITYDETLDIYECKKSKEHNTTAFFNSQGKQLTPFIFEGQSPFGMLNEYSINAHHADGKVRYLEVKKLDPDGQIRSSFFDTKTQKLMIPFKYTFVSYSHDLLEGRADSNSKLDIYNMDGKLLVTDVDFAMKYPEDLNYVIFNRDKLRGVVDYNTGKIVFAPREAECIGVTDDGKYVEFQVELQPTFRRTYYDLNSGKELVPLKKYETADDYGDGLFRVKRNDKYGLYYKGKEIVECTFDFISKFEGGVAQFEKNGEVRLIKNPLLGNSGPEIKQLIADAANKRSSTGEAVSRYPAAESDVDLDIPSGAKKNENLFAFIIANENYPDAPVPYALNDGRAFRKYCENMLGVPEKNITVLEDATYGSIIGAVEKLKKVADAYDGNASVIVYYAGHGFPDEKQQSAYLLPIDGNASDITTTGFSLADFYHVLNTIKLKSAMVFLDACFSGAKREDEMLAQSRGVSIKVKEDRPEGNMVVFSASQGDETAHQMEENRHGLFTYYLLKGLKEQGADTNLGNLTDYVTRQVRRQSVVINDKRQTPSVVPASTVADTWRDMKLSK